MKSYNINDPKYSVILLDEHGQSFTLSVKNRLNWRTLKSAIKHARDMQVLIDKGRYINDAVAVHVEDDCGRIFEHKEKVKQ